MNKSVLLLLAAFSLVACQNNSFTVTCDIPTEEEIADSTIAYLCTYESGTRDRVYTDSAYVIGNKVTITGEIEGSRISRFEIGYKSKLYTNIILEAGEIKIDIEKREATGTKLNNEMKQIAAWADSLENATADEYDAIAKDSTLSADDKQEKFNILAANYNETTLSGARTVVCKNFDNALGQYVFWQYIAYNEGMTPEKYKKELDNTKALNSKNPDYIANYSPIQKITALYKSLEQTQPGADFVDFTISNGNLNGSEVKLSDYVGKGKLILVDMWASWCPPCRAAMPYIRNVYDKYAGEKFDVVSIAVWDKRQNSLDAMPRLGMTWNQIVEAESLPTELYGVIGIPHLMLIGPDGKIIARGLSDTVLDKWVSSELEKME